MDVSRDTVVVTLEEVSVKQRIGDEVLLHRSHHSSRGGGSLEEGV